MDTALAESPRVDPIAYSAGQIQERLYEAINTLAALPDKERKYIYHKLASWPEVKQEQIDILARVFDRLAKFGEINQQARQGETKIEAIVVYDDIHVPRFRPSAAAITRMDQALPWLTRMQKHEFEVLTMRAKGVSFRRIASRYGKSDTTVQRWHNDGIWRVMTYLAEATHRGDAA